MTRKRSARWIISPVLLAWGALGQWSILATPLPGFGVIRGLPPGTSLSRVIIPNLTGKPENRFLLRADQLEVTSQDHARADQVKITLRPGSENEDHLVMKSACFDLITGKISTSTYAMLDAQGVNLACSGLELFFDDSPIVLSGHCTVRVGKRPSHSPDQARESIRRRLPNQFEAVHPLSCPAHLLETWVASQPAQYFQIRQILEAGNPTDTLLFCSDGMELSHDTSLVRMLGSGVILSNGVGIASRGGFTVKTSKLHQGIKSIGLIPEWVQSLDGSSGVRGLVWHELDRRIYICESSTAKYTRSSSSVRFVGGPPVIRSRDGEIRATQDAQYFRIRESGKMMLGSGQWLHRQEVVLDRW